MTETEYQQLADRTLRRIEDGFEDADPDLVDCERSGDVLTLGFKGGKRCVVNTQRPTRQMWLAAEARGWHFDWDAARGLWLDDKKKSEELFATLARIVKDQAGVDVCFR